LGGGGERGEVGKFDAGQKKKRKNGKRGKRPKGWKAMTTTKGWVKILTMGGIVSVKKGGPKRDRDRTQKKKECKWGGGRQSVNKKKRRST